MGLLQEARVSTNVHVKLNEENKSPYSGEDRTPHNLVYKSILRLFVI